MKNKSQIIIYQTDDGTTKLDVLLEEQTVWLTQKMMAELFQTTPQNITIHIKNIYAEGELSMAPTCKDFLQVQKEGSRNVEREQKFYNLDVIISVGYRVKSLRGTQFRIWANQVIKEYLIKGFAMDDERIKAGRFGNYFEELLQRIRDIRSSEKIFWRKVLDIYSTSIDYSPDSDITVEFFKTVQNKMHWAAHGQTAAEVIFKRVDASKPNLGLTNFKGQKPNRQEIEIAKNYLTADELNILNRIVSAYLEMAELKALSQEPMYMRDWKSTLDNFLKLTGKNVLDHSGLISHRQAIEKANEEYAKYATSDENSISTAEVDFLRIIESNIKQIEVKISK